ncbi:MAG: alpha/beta hydrolase [Chitinophagales bacterium]
MNTIKNIRLEGKHHKIILLDVFYKNTQKPKDIVVFAHGFKGFKDWGAWDLVAQSFAEAGFIFAKFNFSYNGTTTENPLDFDDLEAFGHNNYSIESDDLKCVITYLLETQTLINEEEINKNKVHLIGHSRGGGIAILNAYEDKRVTALATWAAINRFHRNWPDEMVTQWKEKGVHYVFNGRTKQQMPMYWQFCEDLFGNKERFDLPKAVQQFSKPFLIVHGTKDSAVKYQDALDMKKWYEKAELFTIENGNHVFGMRHPYKSESLPNDMQKVVDKTIAFFQNN